MANASIGFRNRAVAGVTMSGGSWLSALPRTHMLTVDRSEVARSTDAAAASTQFDIDFGAEIAIRAIGLQGDNISQAGVWRALLGTTLGGTDRHNGANQARWFLPFTGPEEWESDNWWGLPQDEYQGHPYLALIILPSTVNARYLGIRVTDTGNADGYVQIPRLIVCDVWTPEVNMEFGVRYGWKELGSVERTKAGGIDADDQRVPRTATLTFAGLSDTERHWPYEIKRRSRTAQEVLFLPDLADYQECQRYGFVGVLSEVRSGVQRTGFQRNATELVLEEWL